MEHGMEYRTRRLQRAGFSVGVTIPVAMAKALDMRRGDEVHLFVVGDVFCVRRVDRGGFVPGLIAVTPRVEKDRLESRE